MPMNVSSSGPSDKANIFSGLIEYELNSILGALHLERYLLTRGPLGHLLDTAIRCLRQKGWEKIAGCREITVSLNVSMR